MQIKLYSLSNVAAKAPDGPAFCGVISDLIFSFTSDYAGHSQKKNQIKKCINVFRILSGAS